MRAGFNYNFEKLRLECKLVGTEKIGHERVAKITQVSALKFAKSILLFNFSGWVHGKLKHLAKQFAVFSQIHSVKHELKSNPKIYSNLES